MAEPQIIEQNTEEGIESLAGDVEISVETLEEDFKEVNKGLTEDQLKQLNQNQLKQLKVNL